MKIKIPLNKDPIHIQDVLPLDGVPGITTNDRLWKAAGSEVDAARKLLDSDPDNEHVVVFSKSGTIVIYTRETEDRQ